MNNKKIDKDEFEEGLSCVAEDQYNQGYNDARTQQKADIVKLIDKEQEYPNGILYKELIAKRTNKDFKIGFDKYLSFVLLKLKSKIEEM